MKGTPSSMSRSACATEATISPLSASASCRGGLRVADAHLDRPEGQVRADRPPHLRVLHDRLGADEEVDVVAEGLPRAEGVGDPAAREALGEGLRARRVQPAVARVEVGRVGADAEQQGEHRAQPVARADRALDVARADVDVQRERVVAPRDVPQAVDHAAVVLGVDVALLAVVGPRVGAGRAQRHPARLGEGEEPVARVALAAQRVVDVLAAARADLDLAGDELAGDRLGEHRVVGGGEVAQLLEARHEVQRRGVEDGELLLEADGGVGRGGEELLRCGQVDAHGLRSGRSRARRGGPRRGWTCGR